MELIRIDFEQGVLKTDGHTYYIAESISMDRMMKFEELQCGVAYGHTFVEVHSQLGKLKEYLQTAKFVDSAVVLNNLLEALHPDTKAAKKKHYVLQICALFLNEKDEDVKTWNEATINAKIDDWLEAGVDYRDFFQLAVRLVPGLLDVLKETFLTISQMEEAMKQSSQSENE